MEAMRSSNNKILNNEDVDDIENAPNGFQEPGPMLGTFYTLSHLSPWPWIKQTWVQMLALATF